MNRDDAPSTVRMHGAWRVLLIAAVLLLFPPFFLLAVAPMLLMLGPVALIAIPMIVPALLLGLFGARSQVRRRSLRKPSLRPVTTRRLIFRS